MEKCICPICESKIENEVLSIEGYRKGLFFDITFCNNCDLSYVISRKDDSEIYNLIYANSKIIPGYSRYEEYKSDIKKQKIPLKYLASKESMYWVINDCIEKGDIKKTDKILEIGCGLGYLTYALRKNNLSVLGIDISEKAVSEAKIMFGDYYKCINLFGYSEKTEERYNVIIMTEVIEHLTDPILFMEEVKKMLAPNGKIIITTPDKSFFNDLGLKWSTDLPPVHFWWFSKKTLKNLSDRINLDIEFVNFTKFNTMSGNIQFFKNKERLPILDYDGSVLNPVINKKSNLGDFKKRLKVGYLKLFRIKLSSSRIIGAVLTLK